MKFLLALALLSAFSIQSSMAAAKDGIVVLQAKVYMDSPFADFQNIQVADGKLVTATMGLNTEKTAAIAKEGFAAFAKNGSGIQLKECANAVLAVRAGAGNFLPNPNGEENFRMPEVISFVCVE